MTQVEQRLYAMEKVIALLRIGLKLSSKSRIAVYCSGSCNAAWLRPATTMHRQIFIIRNTNIWMCWSTTQWPSHLRESGITTRAFPDAVRLCCIPLECNGHQSQPKNERHSLQEWLRRQEISNQRWKLIFTNIREICQIAECEKGHNAIKRREIVKIAMFGAAMIIGTKIWG